MVGEDVVTGEKLGVGERAVSGLFLLPIGRLVDDVSEITIIVVKAKKCERYLEFTSDNLRHNLARRTGFYLQGAQAHHIFPKSFADKLERLGIDVNDPQFGAWWEAHDHSRNWSNYNNDWTKFFEKKLNASAQDAFLKAKELSLKYRDIVNSCGLHEIRRRLFLVRR